MEIQFYINLEEQEQVWIGIEQYSLWILNYQQL
jgi:hypothetical protein